MTSKLLALSIGTVLVGACFARRPPTTSVEVVGEIPEGAVRVGPVLPIWVEESECKSPPREVVLQAQKWGADFIVPEPRDVRVMTTGKQKSVCKAYGYAAK